MKTESKDNQVNKNSGTPSLNFVTFVEIFFAVVLGSSILEFRDYLFPPNWNNPSFWALTSVYFTAVTSWFGWHKSTAEYPYKDDPQGYLGSALDALIVTSYAALLLFGSNVNKSFWPNTEQLPLILYLVGFVVIFLLYYLSGFVRTIEYGPKASNRKLIIIHGAILLAGLIFYTVISNLLSGNYNYVLWILVELPLIVIISYRYFRNWRGLKWTKTKTRKLQIAIDLDGVLAEQVIPVLQKLKQEMNIDVNKYMITDWEYPIGGTNIKIEIEKAERQEDFVKKMPLIEGAADATRMMSEKFQIVIATSREVITDDWNRDWLVSHGIKYDTFINTHSTGKKLDGIDILVDDYVGNIKTFINGDKENRRAILFAQPWNQNIREIADLITEKKVEIAHSWDAVLALLDCDKS